MSVMASVTVQMGQMKTTAIQFVVINTTQTHQIALKSVTLRTVHVQSTTFNVPQEGAYLLQSFVTNSKTVRMDQMNSMVYAHMIRIKQ